jgi:hypothetical protein
MQHNVRVLVEAIVAVHIILFEALISAQFVKKSSEYLESESSLFVQESPTGRYAEPVLFKTSFNIGGTS